MPAATSLNCCNAFIRSWLSRYGAPRQIFCDNGNTYTAKLWDDLTRVLGIQVQFVPLYHQSTNGAIERQHRTLKESIKASLIEMGNIHRDKWMQQLPLTLLGRRVSLQEDMGASSAQLVFGADPIIPGVLVPDEPERKEDIHELLKTVQMSSDNKAVPMSDHSKPYEYYVPKNLQEADYVYVKLDNPTNLGAKYVGPHAIVDRPSNTTITVRHKQKLNLERHRSSLTPL